MTLEDIVIPLACHPPHSVYCIPYINDTYLQHIHSAWVLLNLQPSHFTLYSVTGTQSNYEICKIRSAMSTVLSTRTTDKNAQIT